MGVCGACEQENPAGARFCNACGTLLATAPASRQKRKTVTVLFCDVTGSTALGERLDPESFRQVMRRYFDTARRVIEHHGGTVEKFIGDAVMAVFGVPVVHEDDALRAVRAAAGLRAEIDALNSDLQAGFGTTVSLRIGANTGEVVTGSDERLATGDAVNLAARLEQAAAPGEIILGAQTWRLVRDSVLAEPLAPLQLKGKSLPVSAYRLVQLADGAAGKPPRAEPPLVGRKIQLRLLRDAYANVTRERCCGLFTVLGTAGVGKSRLAAEALRDIDARVLTGLCLSYGQGITYWPLVSMVRQLLDPERGCAAAAELMMRDSKVAAAVGVLLGEQEGVTSQAEIAWAARRLLESSAERAPLVAVFDDLHWAEPALLELIEHVADFSRDSPMLLLCLGRPELLERRPDWSGGKLNATTLLLEPLNAAETAELIDQLTPADAGIDAGLRERVQRTAAGNPLFVEEILALLLESGGGDLVIPPTISALLAARLDQLPRAERTVLECGSVEGQSFHRGTVRALAPDEPDVQARLMTLVQKDLLRPDRPVLPGEDGFKFRHLLIRDAAYEALAKADRADLHERFADWLKDHGEGLVELDEILGYHLEQAFRYRSELGPVIEKDRWLAAAAAVHLEAAGRRAMDRGDTGAAVQLLGRAEALRPAHEPNVAAAETMVRALALSGRLDEAVSHAAAAADECSSAGNPIGELRLRLLGTIWRISVDPSGQMAALTALTNEARPVIERHGDAAALAVLEHADAYLDFLRGRLTKALAAATRAMQHASQTGDRWLEGNMRTIATGCLVNGPTPIDDVLEWLDDARAQSAAYQPTYDLHAAHMLGQAGHFAEARALIARTIAQAAERGRVLSVASAMLPAWETEMLAGDDAAAERMARQGCEQFDRLGEHSYLSTLACELAASLYELGRYGEAEHWVLRGLELGGPDDVSTQVCGLCVRSKLLARTGDLDAALALAKQADSLARASDAQIERGDAALNLAGILHLTGDQAGAGVAARRAIRCYRRKGATAYLTRAQRLVSGWTAGSPAAPAGQATT